METQYYVYVINYGYFVKQNGLEPFIRSFVPQSSFNLVDADKIETRLRRQGYEIELQEV